MLPWQRIMQQTLLNLEPSRELLTVSEYFINHDAKRISRRQAIDVDRRTPQGQKRETTATSWNRDGAERVRSRGLQSVWAAGVVCCTQGAELVAEVYSVC